MGPTDANELDVKRVLQSSLHPIFADVELDNAVALFGTAAVADVESRLVLRGPRSFVRCRVRNKEVVARREELIRQLWLVRLENHYRYPVERMSVEYPITFGRDSSKRADIVVFDADRPTVPYVIVEVKEPTARDGKDQLKSYTHATGAPLALWSDGAQAIIWHRKNPNYFVELPDLPGATQTIDDIAGQPWTVETLVAKERDRELEGRRARSLRVHHGELL